MTGQGIISLDHVFVGPSKGGPVCHQEQYFPSSLEIGIWVLASQLMVLATGRLMRLLYKMDNWRGYFLESYNCWSIKRWTCLSARTIFTILIQSKRLQTWRQLLAGSPSPFSKAFFCLVLQKVLSFQFNNLCCTST